MLKTIHTALLAGQILFATVVVVLIQIVKVQPAAPDLDKTLQVIAALASAVGYFGGRFLFNKRLAEMQGIQHDLPAKLSAYTSASILQWALLEAPCIFNIICFFLTGNYAFIGLVLLLIFVFMTTAPIKPKVALHLQVNEPDLEGL